MANLIRLIRTGDFITHGNVTIDREGELYAPQKLEATRNYIFDYSDYFASDATVTSTLEATNCTAVKTDSGQTVEVTASGLKRYGAHFVLTLTETGGEVFDIRLNINAQERMKGYGYCGCA